MLFRQNHCTSFFLRIFFISTSFLSRVVVTGCDSGFGLMISLKLSALGFYVVATCLTDKGVADLKEKQMSNLIPIKFDITKEEDILNLKALVESKLKELNVKLWAVINNAGWFFTLSI
jgi:NAD(P)-dependent dehydrogenase (short-subunit alcohol dehydrogenase family)